MVLPWLNDLVAWLNTLPFGLTVRRTLWVIPLMSTIHILAIGMVLSSVIMIDLRIWGVSRSQTLVQSGRRALRRGDEPFCPGVRARTP